MTISGNRSPSLTPGGRYNRKRRIPEAPIATPEIHCPAPVGGRRFSIADLTTPSTTRAFTRKLVRESAETLRARIPAQVTFLRLAI